MKTRLLAITLMFISFFISCSPARVVKPQGDEAIRERVSAAITEVDWRGEFEHLKNELFARFPEAEESWQLVTVASKLPSAINRRDFESKIYYFSIPAQPDIHAYLSFSEKGRLYVIVFTNFPGVGMSTSIGPS